MDYWKLTAIVSGIVILIDWVIIFFLFVRTRKNKKIFSLVKEIRKGLREHHKAESKLFRAVDDALITLSLRRMPNKRVVEEVEYG